MRFLAVLVIIGFLVAAYLDSPERTTCLTNSPGIVTCLEEGINGEAVVCRYERENDNLASSVCYAVVIEEDRP
jgi:hypothetical protein